MMSKESREIVFWAIPWCIIGIMTMWSSFDQRDAINTNRSDIRVNAGRIADHEAVVVVELRDRFTRTNFSEWRKAFFEANPHLTSPQVEFTPLPPIRASP